MKAQHTKKVGSTQALHQAEEGLRRGQISFFVFALPAQSASPGRRGGEGATARRGREAGGVAQGQEARKGQAMRPSTGPARTPSACVGSRRARRLKLWLVHRLRCEKRQDTTGASVPSPHRTAPVRNHETADA